MVLTILIIVLGIALAVVYLNREKDEEKARLAILALTAAIVVVAMLRLFLPSRTTAPAYDTTTDNAIGGVIADRIAAVADGRKVVIVSAVARPSPFLTARVAGFQERMAANGFEVLGVSEAYPQEILEANETLPDEGLDARAIGLAIERFPDAEIVVSMVGYPTHNFDRIIRDVQQLEFYIFADFVGQPWQEAVARGIVDGLFIQPLDAVWNDTSGTVEDIFDRRYAFVTRENMPEVLPRVAIPEDTF